MLSTPVNYTAAEVLMRRLERSVRIDGISRGWPDSPWLTYGWHPLG